MHQIHIVLAALLTTCTVTLAMEQTSKISKPSTSVIYFRPQLGYLFSQSEFLIFLAKEDYDSVHHRPPNAILKQEQLSQEKREHYNQSVLFEFKRALKRRADVMVVDKHYNSLMHLVLKNNWPPSRNLIKILIPGTLWLECNEESKCVFDFFEPYGKHKECADLIIHDIMRYLCFKKKINFKHIKTRYSVDDQYIMLKSYFEKIHSLRQLVTKKHRKSL